ncbi:hypothetical protein U9M48_010156 [Paspalum notatum var. saurae]|uniref:Uncharacterized protein n=1 Tax=Paspalum notatum var. saurae TaxID=547442 RepID=A0AAQ3SU62_PASNO
MNLMCTNGSSYGLNSTYHSNVVALLGSLTADASNSTVGFATGTVGGAPNQVWGLALCRGDVNGTSCASCLALVPGVAFGDGCRGSKDASVYYDRCLLQFSDQDFLASPDDPTAPAQYGLNLEVNITGDPGRFVRLAADLMGALSAWAAHNSTSRYAAGVATSAAGFTTTDFDLVHDIYGLVQCTPDQTPAACQGCLDGLRARMPALFTGTTGAQFNLVWCNLRYEVYPFYDSSPVVNLVAPPSTPTPAPASAPGQLNDDHDGEEEDSGSLLFDLTTLRRATENFAEENKLGHGGFGGVARWPADRCEEAGPASPCPKTSSPIPLSVRRIPSSNDSLRIFSIGDVLDPLVSAPDPGAGEPMVESLPVASFCAPSPAELIDGAAEATESQVCAAVGRHRLTAASEQGLKQLKNELLLVAKLRHNNLAKLYGVCLKEQEKLLVYEYLPNRSLDTFLFVPEKRALLDWATRYRIIYGTARGLLYLHEDSQIKVMHRDLKASNILLDADMNPKISDFGLARLFNGDKTTTVTSQVVGTLGYMAPEYAVMGLLSVKLDVYSFGVLVLEVVTGRRNTDACFESGSDVQGSSTMLSYVWDHWSNGRALETMDPSLEPGHQAPESEALKCIHLALLCVQENPADRPTMLDVLVMLHGQTSSFAAPSKPAFAFTQAGDSNVSSGGSGNDGGASAAAAAVFSVNEMSITEFQPR